MPHRLRPDRTRRNTPSARAGRTWRPISATSTCRGRLLLRAWPRRHGRPQPRAEVPGTTPTTPAGRARKSFLYDYGHTQQPGTSETSRISYDFINNPNTMNPIFNLGSRPVFAETAPGGDPVLTRHVLKDGRRIRSAWRWRSSRVWINIGCEGNDWFDHLFDPVSGRRQQPFRIDELRTRRRRQGKMRAPHQRRDRQECSTQRPDLARTGRRRGAEPGRRPPTSSRTRRTTSKRARRQGLPQGRREAAAARQGAVRGPLRPLPLQQAADLPHPGVGKSGLLPPVGAVGRLPGGQHAERRPPLQGDGGGHEHRPRWRPTRSMAHLADSRRRTTRRWSRSARCG